MITLEEQIEFIIENFDFKKVHKIMTVLDWEWAGCDGVPTILDMKSMVRGLFKSLMKHEDSKHCASGGFKASRKKNEFGVEYYELEFIAEEYSGEWAD